jgi:hypothetical protein
MKSTQSTNTQRHPTVSARHRVHTHKKSDPESNPPHRLHHWRNAAAMGTSVHAPWCPHLLLHKHFNGGLGGVEVRGVRGGVPHVLGHIKDAYHGLLASHSAQPVTTHRCAISHTPITPQSYKGEQDTTPLLPPRPPSFSYTHKPMYPNPHTPTSTPANTTAWKRGRAWMHSLVA